MNRASSVALLVKNLPANARDVRDMVLIPGLGRSLRGGHGNPHLVGCSPWGHKELDVTEVT